MKSIITLLACLSFFIIGLSNLKSQNTINTFAIPYNGSDLTVTHNIEAKYLGEYAQLKGSERRQYRLRVGNEGSYIWRPTLDAASNTYIWQKDSQEPITWGVLVEKEQIVLTEITEMFRDGAKTFQAMTLVYYNAQKQKSEQLYLYERNGEVVLGNAIKVAEEAEFAKDNK
jgi:hypothetical protein